MMGKRSVKMLVVTAVLLVLGVLALVRYKTPAGRSELTGVVAEFVECLPEDLTEAQRLEIEGLLVRFQKRAEAGKIYPEDIREVVQLFGEYVEKGSIGRSELNLLMAKVGYYSFRADLPDDTTGVHPLLLDDAD